MQLSKLDKEQALKVLKAAAYVGVSAAVDFAISQSTDSQFGTLTPIVNVCLVALKQLLTKPKA